MKVGRFVVLCTTLSLWFHWGAYGLSLKGNIIAPREIKWSQGKLRALVFLSDQCPCSRSHVSHLNQLKQRFNIDLYGVISDPDITADRLDYFKKGFEFPVVKDPTQSLVVKHKALKTPHVILFSSMGKPLYEGGVSDHQTFEKAKKKYLEENLTRLVQNKALKYRYGKALGCHIKRKKIKKDKI